MFAAVHAGAKQLRMIERRGKCAVEEDVKICIVSSRLLRANGNTWDP